MAIKPKERLCDFEVELRNEVYECFREFDIIALVKFKYDDSMEKEYFGRMYKNIWKDVDTVANRVMEKHIMGYAVFGVY